ncbi:MAG: DNA topoisomerase (ATP-hydrolyzing) subunit B [Candidatus Anstonellales archaeon]
MENNEYTAKDIKVLKGLEGVRLRPAMYIGDTGKKGMHHLLWEVIDNSVDEAMAGYCKNIIVEIQGNAAIISDDGRGIPVETHPETGKSTLETVVTMLHAGGKFEKTAYKVSGGLHGVGISVVCALSQEMEVIVKRNNKIYRQKYSKGNVLSQVEEIGKTENSETGTIVKFVPDKEIFGDEQWDSSIIRTRLKEIAYLNPGLSITFIFNGEMEKYLFNNGLIDFVKAINEAKKPIHENIAYIKSEENDAIAGNVAIEIALQYNETFYDSIHAFTNTIRNEEGGTHVIGFKAALTRGINEYMRKNGQSQKVSGEDVLEGLAAVLHVRIPSPQFEGQTKTKLGNNEIKGIVERIFYDKFQEWLERHGEDAKIIMKKVISAMEAREAARKAKETVRRKSVFETSMLPGKLADCIEKNVEKAELFIVEGESAGGSAKQARAREFQAIMPLKGKVINVEKANRIKVLSNEEIRALITAIGTGIKEEFDISKLRYGKIIIMTDADVDGNHIKTLLLTFFFRYMRPLIENGHIYIAHPPLYKITKGKAIYYAYSEEEKENIVNKIGNCNIQRYKGLGEMNPEQLWETTMQPEKRIIDKVTIKDAEIADELFSILMGEDVEKRKTFIETYALEGELDI